MQDFMCITDTINSMKTTLDEIQTILDNTYSSVFMLETVMFDENNWSGESQLVGAAFMSLVTQYHALLAGAGEGPVKQASDGLQNYMNKDAVFYDEWEEYQEVLSMW